MWWSAQKIAQLKNAVDTLVADVARTHPRVAQQIKTGLLDRTLDLEAMIELLPRAHAHTARTIVLKADTEPGGILLPQDARNNELICMAQEACEALEKKAQRRTLFSPNDPMRTATSLGYGS